MILAGVLPGCISFKGAREPFWRIREEASALGAVDVTELDVLYRNLPSCQPEPAGDSMVAEEMRATVPSTEPITFPAESDGEMTAVSLMPPVLELLA